MDYPRCATCKHWDEDTDAYDGPRHGICLRVTAADKESWGGDPIVHYSGGEYHFTTREDFGCVLHEPREE